MDDHPKQERLKFSWKYEKFIYDCVLARSYIITSLKVNLWLKTAQTQSTAQW